MRLKPLGERIVVRRDDPEKVSRGGIVIPDNAAAKATRGVVVAIGKGTMLASGAYMPPQVKVGDRVLFSLYGGMTVDVDGETLLVVNQGDLMGVME